MLQACTIGSLHQAFQTTCCLTAETAIVYVLLHIWMQFQWSHDVSASISGAVQSKFTGLTAVKFNAVQAFVKCFGKSECRVHFTRTASRMQTSALVCSDHISSPENGIWANKLDLFGWTKEQIRLPKRVALQQNR